mgnify:CR=1 FL=1
MEGWGGGVGGGVRLFGGLARRTGGKGGGWGGGGKGWDVCMDYLIWYQCRSGRKARAEGGVRMLGAGLCDGASG